MCSVLVCGERLKMRCTYRIRILTPLEVKLLQTLKEDNFYLCGCFIFAEDFDIALLGFLLTATAIVVRE